MLFIAEISKMKIFCSIVSDGNLKRKLAITLLWALSLPAHALKNANTENSNSKFEIPYFVYELKEVSTPIVSTNSNKLSINPSNTIIGLTPGVQSTAYLSVTGNETKPASTSESGSSSTYYIITENIKKLASSAVSSTIKQIRTTICDAAGDADAKIWVYFGADGNVGVGASAGAQAQSGIEIVFHCNKNDVKQS